MHGMEFIHNVQKTIAPVTDETYERIIPLDISITLKHLLDLMRDADLQKRRLFYGQQIRQSTSAEWEALSYVHQQLSPIPDDTHSQAKGKFASPLPSLQSLPPEIRQQLDRMLNRYHAVLGLLSEIAELATVDTLILQQVLTNLYEDPTGNDFYETVEDARDSVKYTKKNIFNKYGLECPEQRDEAETQYEESADILFYMAHHLSTNIFQSSAPVSLDDLCSAVVAKLRERYPGAFSLTHSENHVRDKAKEMAAFYKGLKANIPQNIAYVANEAAFKTP